MPDCDNLYEQRFKALEDRVEKNSNKFGGIYDRLGALETDNKLTKYQFEEIMKTVKDIKDDLEKSIQEIKSGMKALENRPAQNWQSLINTLITAGVGGIIGFTIQKLFGG